MSQAHSFIAHLKPDEPISGTYLVREKSLGTGKTGKNYVAMNVADRSGAIDCRIWENADDFYPRFEADDFVTIEGTVQLYQNRKQIVIRKLQKCAADAVDLNVFMPTTRFDVDKMFAELGTILETIENPHVRWLGLEIIRHPEVTARFKKAPAARTIHHAWIGGLLEHTLSVVKLAEHLGRTYPMIDRSYLVFGAAFHDFAKIFELKYDTGFSYTFSGRMVGHLVMGVTWIDQICRQKPDFPEEVKILCQHLIVAHHGKLEHGSPKLPQTIEALVLNLIDNLDSKVHGIASFLAEDEVKPGQWSGYHQFNQSYYYVPTNGALANWLQSRKAGEKNAEEARSEGKRFGNGVPEALRDQLMAMVKK